MGTRLSSAVSASLVAGLVLFFIQIVLAADDIWANLTVPSMFLNMIKILSAFIIVLCFAALFHFVEQFYIYRPSIKYRRFSSMVALALGHYFRDVSKNGGSRNENWHKRKIDKLCELISIFIRESLNGDKFQVSIFQKDCNNELYSCFAWSSDAAHVDSFAQKKTIPIGQGFAGKAYESLTPQSGNGDRRWNLSRDPRISVSAWGPKTKDFGRSYLAIPIAAPPELSINVLGVLTIDSDSPRDFLPGSRYAKFLSTILLPLVSVLEYHLVEIEKKREKEE